jgi:hypothetical protein
MNQQQDDSVPAGFSDAGGAPYWAFRDDSDSGRGIVAAKDPPAAAIATTSTPNRVLTETSHLQ